MMPMVRGDARANERGESRSGAERSVVGGAYAPSGIVAGQLSRRLVAVERRAECHDGADGRRQTSSPRQVFEAPSSVLISGGAAAAEELD